jgi:hypothetical protein
MSDDLTIEAKPKKVKTAISLIILSLSLSFAYGIYKGITKPIEHHGAISATSATRQLISALLLFVIMIAIVWFLLYHLNAGKNWARIFCSFVLALGIFYFLLYFSYYFKENIMHAIIRTIQTLLDVTVVIFLNSKEVLAWYNPKSIENISK